MLFSQGDTCESAAPFCSTDGNGLILFRNTSGNSFAEAGPNYGCLLEQPNPAWYFLKIGDDGDLNLRISQNTRSDGAGIGLDVDFIVWGPFASSSVCTSSNLSQANTVACSFSEDSIENFTIPDAKIGEFYMLVMTNYSGQPGYITLDQTGGNGSTDCSIVAESLRSDPFPCEGETVLLDGSTDGAVGYEWFLNDVAIPNENEATLEVTTSGTYKVRVSDRQGNTDEVETIVSFVNVPIPNAPETIEICALNDNMGSQSSFNLLEYNSIVLGATDPSLFRVSYHASQLEAENGTNAISSVFTNNIVPELIYIRLESTRNNTCYKTTTAPLIVNSLPEFELGDNAGVCVDAQGNLEALLLDSGLPTAGYSFAWHLNNQLLLNETKSTLETNLVGDYTLLVTNLITGCQKSDTIKIIPSSPPISYSAEVVTPAFVENNRIEVSVTGEGNYEFSLDNGPFQQNSFFESIAPGNHTITIQDKNGCGSVDLGVFIIDFPRFFTPNGDDINDTWHIPESELITDITIQIFNRFGSLVSQLTPNGPGWDGRYNGQQMPSSDYWFMAHFIENNRPQSFKGHFSLKR